MSNDITLRSTPRIPLPQGPDHEAWIFDTTPLAWLRKTWPAHKCPYAYTPAGVWVRKAMPKAGCIRAQRLLAKLTDFADRMQGDLHDEFKLPRSCSAQDLAELILATAVIERDTPFMVYRIKPNGRTIVFHRLRPLVGSWHPNSPKRGAQ
jgi:hypothetical protein